LVTFYLLFAMELAIRRVHLAGYTRNPDDFWMMQIARNLSDATEGFLRGKKYLLMDRDSKFSEAFRSILDACGVETMRLPPRSPNLSPHLERFMRSVKEECLERIIFLGERSLRNALREFLVHFHSERNHQGLDNRLIEAADQVGHTTGEIQCRERLGGLLQYYYRKAA
jgi:putative transposase